MRTATTSDTDSALPWHPVVNAVQALAALRDDWDGQGAAAPSAGVLATALELVGLLPRAGFAPPSAAVATPAGTVLLSWQAAPQYLEVEVVSPTLVEWMAIGRDGAPRHGLYPHPEGKALGVDSWLAAGLQTARRQFEN